MAEDCPSEPLPLSAAPLDTLALLSFIRQWRHLSEERIPGRPCSFQQPLNASCPPPSSPTAEISVPPTCPSISSLAFVPDPLPFACNFLIDEWRWLMLPECWRDFFLSLKYSSLCALLRDMRMNLTIPTETLHPPASLLQWLHAVRSFSLCRSRHCYQRTASLPPSLRRHMSPKKRHEVEHLLPLIEDHARAMGIRDIIDIGSGVGYLSHALAFMSGLRVISVECDGLHATKNELRAAVVCGAKAARATAKRAREEAAAQRGEGGTRSEPLKSALSWPISSGGEEKGGGSVTVIQHRISGSSSSFMGKIAEAVQMQSSVKEWQEAVLHEGDEGGVALRPAAYHEVASAAELEKIADRGSEGDSARLWNRRFALVGLHTCGNLALSTMDAFLAHESAQLLVLVACCYSKSVSGEGYGQTWEPISSAVRAALHEHTQSGAGGESGGQISLLCEASLMTACHGNLSQRQVGCGGDDMTFFRLLYQLYLSQFVCRDALESVRGLHVSTATSFSDYCVRVAAVSRKKEQKVRGSSEMEASMCEVASSGSERSTPVAVDVLMETATGGLAASHSSQAEPGRTLGSEDELDSFFEAHVHLRVRVLVYWTLRSIFGEAVESLILTDRLLYMEESGVAARLFPVFEPSASPRCICLVAEKLAPGKPLLSGPLSSENCAALKRQHPE